VTIISTGSESVDKLLDGGIKTGHVTDIFGNSKYARNSLSLSICINAVRNLPKSVVIFVDTQGNFRPEILLNYLNNNEEREILRRIIVVRLYSARLLSSLIKKSISYQPEVLLVDNFTSLWNTDFHGIAKHLSIMRSLRELALAALDHDVATIITNPSVPRIHNVLHREGMNPNAKDSIPRLIYQETLGSSLSLFTSIVLSLERIENQNSNYTVKLVKPAKKSLCRMGVNKGLIHDVDNIE
jgi:RecA/RadA recombinase